MNEYQSQQLELKKSILIQALNHVPFDGWSEKSLLAAASDLGVSPATALNLYPGRGLEMVSLHSQYADRLMIDDFRKLDNKPNNIAAQIEIFIQVRLQRWNAHREAIRSGTGLLLSPGNIPLGSKLLYQTIDCIWREIGDRSTDFNFYTKRATLSAIYAATLFYWLDDKSEGHWNTWKFLERSLARLGRIPKIKAKTKKWRRYLPDPFLFYNELRKRTFRPIKRVR